MPDPGSSTAARFAQWSHNLLEQVRGTHAAHRTNIPLLARLTAHLGIIALTIIGLLLSTVEIRAAGPADPSVDNSQNLPDIQLDDPTNSGFLLINAVPPRFQPQQPERPRLQVLQYTVQPGDSVTGIAARFHISPNSIIWANVKLQDDADSLSLGQVLNIPPTSGVLYTVAKGDSVQSIAAKFKAKPEDLLNDPFNQSNHNFKVDPPVITEGTFIMVPGGQKVVVVKRIATTATPPKGSARGTTNFVWPVSGCLFQNFWALHPGMDIDAPKGTPIYASDSGFVELVGWDNTGYGNMILLNHGNGYATRYGHLSAFNVEPGQSVKKGSLIGRVGSTGHSTGPHLHFELIKGGVRVNPAYYVAGRGPARCPGYYH